MSSPKRRGAIAGAAVLIIAAVFAALAVMRPAGPGEPANGPAAPAAPASPATALSAPATAAEPPVASAPLPSPSADASAAPPDCKDLSPPDPSARRLDTKPSNRLRGADASSLAPWRTLREAGVGFAFAGATHGLTKNPSFAENWAMMKRCGLPRAAYHFLTDKSEGALQARAFAEQLEGDPGELPPALDVEKPSDCRGDCCELSCSQWSVITRAFIDEFERRTSRQPMIYTVEPFWNQCLCGTTNHKTRPLWLAGWPKFDFPERLRFGGWSRWTFYQYAGNVRVAGGVVDFNIFRGTADDLERWIRTGEPPQSDD